MKKSKLLNIIKRSVKETLLEQYTTESFVEICDCNKYDLGTNQCYNGFNGPNGGWTFNLGIVQINNTINNIVPPSAGDKICTINSVTAGGVNSGNVSDCANQTRIVVSIINQSITPPSGVASRPKLYNYTPCGIDCTDPNSVNYNSLANTPCNSSGYDSNADPNLDNDCCIATIYGCMDPNAINYDPNANNPDN